MRAGASQVFEPEGVGDAGLFEDRESVQLSLKALPSLHEFSNLAEATWPSFHESNDSLTLTSDPRPQFRWRLSPSQPVWNYLFPDADYTA